jgi:hypothetical protein
MRPSWQGGEEMHGVAEAKGGVFPEVLPLHSNDRINNDNNNNNNRGGTSMVIYRRKSAEDGNEPTPTDIIVIGSSELNSNGLWFVPYCGTCFKTNKFMDFGKTQCSQEWKKHHLDNTGKFVVFPAKMWHQGYC